MENKSAYAIKHISHDIVMNSSSGGAFTALSDLILDLNGAVFGACYDSKRQNVFHQKALKKQERDKMRGSKYIWSEIGRNVYEDLASEAVSEKWILFTGTPCQVQSAKTYLHAKGVPTEKVIFSDLICHGTPEPRLWKDYVAYFNKKYGCKIERINFKDKRDCWKRPQSFAYCGEREISIADYTDLFYSQCILREGCYKCKFASTQRVGDITLGDCWGIEKNMPDFYDHFGVSIVLVNTEKGRRIFEQIQKNVEWRSVDLKDYLQHNLVKPTAPSPQRSAFIRDYNRFGIRFVLFKYSKHRLYGKIRHKIAYLKNKH